MKSYYDEVTDLEWVTFNRSTAPYDPQYQDFIEQINTWSANENIRKFICQSYRTGTLIDDFFQGLDNTDFFFALRDNELVAATLLSQDTPLSREDQLVDYLYFKRYEDKPQEMVTIEGEEYLDFDDTVDLLNNKNKENTYIEYILVNPKYHGKGIGTAITNCIKRNLDFFSQGKDVGVLQASIDNENIASRKAILKNGFKKMKPHNKKYPFSTYYYCVQKQRGDSHEKL